MMLIATVLLAVVIQLTSAQPTYDNNQHNDVIRDVDRNSKRTSGDRILMEMLLTMSKLQNNVAELKAAEQRSFQELQKLKADVSDIKSVQSTYQQSFADIKSAINNSLGSTAKVCPAHFTYIAAVNGCYKVVLNNLDWSVAGLRCRSLHKDAHLVFINSAKEQSYIVGIISRYSDSALRNCFKFTGQDGHLGTAFWTGGQRIDPLHKSPFVWKAIPSSGTTGVNVGMLEMTYTHWHKGEPNYYKTPRFSMAPEACLHLPSGFGYRWNDIPCGIPSCSVCELDLHK